MIRCQVLSGVTTCYQVLLHVTTRYHRYPDSDQLQTVYGTYLAPVLHHCLGSHPVWGSTAKIHALAGSMVQVYEQVREGSQTSEWVGGS